MAKPAGVRSCWRDFQAEVRGDGGSWELCRARNGGTPVWDEIRRALASFPADEELLLRGELGRLMDLAKKGELHFGRGEGFDVDFMECTRDVLELKFPGCQSELGEQLHLRVYFTEPAARPRELLLLAAHAKRDSPVGLAEQNEWAEIAQERADAHDLYLRLSC